MHSSKQLGLFIATVLLSWGKMSSGALIGQSRDLVESSEPDYRIFLVRHGNTPANTADLIQGWRDDDIDEETGLELRTYKLDDQGRQEAANAGKKLSQVPIGKIFSCPLSRALETAEIIKSKLKLEYPGVEIVQNEDLRGLGFGSWEGQKVERTKENLDWVDGAKHGGESVETYEGRTIKFLKEEVLGPQSKMKHPKDVLISTHQWSIKVMMKHLKKNGATNGEEVNLEKVQSGGSISEIQVWLKGDKPRYHLQRFGEKPEGNPLA